MWFEVEFRDYRCFSSQNPARLALAPIVTTIVGPNNSGKSALLRFFYEARPLFRLLGQPNEVSSLLCGSSGVTGIQALPDPAELLSNFNENDLRVTFNLREMLDPGNPAIVPSAATIVIDRQLRWYLELRVGKTDISHCVKANFTGAGCVLTKTDGDRVVVDLSPFIKLWSELEHSMYVGPVRHAGSGGGTQYDIESDKGL